ncbi:MAG: YCF48-related protein, partial [Bradyrhizobium sp.]
MIAPFYAFDVIDARRDFTGGLSHIRAALRPSSVRIYPAPHFELPGCASRQLRRGASHERNAPMSTAKDWKWVATNSPIATSRTDDIWFFNEKQGWLVNSNGQVSQTQDGGQTWTQKKFIDPNSTGFPYLRCMGWANEKIGWIGAVTVFDDGNKDYLQVLMHKTTDGGATWTNLTNMPITSPAGVCGMSVVNEKVVYGAGTNDPDLPGPGFVKTTDGGATWTHTSLSQHADNLIDVYFSDENTGWIVGGKKDSGCPTIKPGYETHPQ